MKEIMILLAGWLFVGFITLAIAMKFDKDIEQITLYEAAGPLLFGPIGLLLILFMIFEDKGSKLIVWRRKK